MLYQGRKHKTFMDDLARDLDDNNAWYNNSEFSRYHTLNGRKIHSIFANDTKTSSARNYRLESDVPFGVTHSDGILICRAQELSNVKAGQSVNLDGRDYIISRADLLLEQVWKIYLTRVQE